MGQIIKPICVCVPLCLCVRLRALSRSHFLIDFHHNYRRRKNPKKNEFVGDQHCTTSSPILSPKISILPPKTSILSQKVLKSMQILMTILVGCSANLKKLQENVLWYFIVLLGPVTNISKVRQNWTITKGVTVTSNMTSLVWPCQWGRQI